MKNASSESINTPPKPRPIVGFTIDRETLEHLPELHRAAAEIAIRTGRWRLIENFASD
jgi:hypothetical protein